MPNSLTKTTIEFLKDLKINNNREWFQDNKNRYEDAKNDFEAFFTDVLAGVAAFDSSVAHLEAKKCIFRIYRDVRFSKDKSPYKTHLSAHITPAGSRGDIHGMSGYYLHLGPGESMLAGGAYQPEKNWLAKIRQEIDYNGEDLDAILKNEEFKNTFGYLDGEKLKRSPKDYDENHPRIELLKMKSFVARKTINDSELTEPDFLKKTIETFRVLKPFGDFLNRN